MRFKDEHPELFRQLHSTRNTGVDLESITNSSHEMLWWRCPVGHECRWGVIAGHRKWLWMGTAPPRRM
ncbi:zinc-ribbon domain-containing protein [Rhodococcus opacus]|uniref:zinc-ribbon domain-containing protein n=1 Tax=Rhodococcus opacus TaxID=37919 RepID=UPI001F586032|nr:zinc-ribbon domain-containing protein [Rhodococcus opacus]UNN04977.1 zinc-ribbon domain-containing protein [Rhodococcus opacus]